MADRRPLPDSEEMQKRRANERLARWATVLILLIVVAVAVFVGIH